MAMTSSGHDRRTTTARLALACALAAGCAPTGGEEARVRGVDAPRPLAPLAATVVNDPRPTLRWQLKTGMTGAEVELCRDRGCAEVALAFRARGDAAAPPEDLAPGLYFWRVRAATAAGVGEAASHAWALVVGRGRGARGAVAGGVSDFDGDGRPDLAVGAPRVGDYAGRAYVYRGTPEGLARAPAARLAGDGQRRESFGDVVAGAGDLDGDGYGDLAVGAPAIYTDRVGRVYVFRGGPGGVATAPSAVLAGRDGAPELFGYAVAGLGDVDGDGYGDLAVGAPDAAGAAGRVYVFHGGPALLGAAPDVIEGAAGAGAAFGQSVAGLGDVDGDGRPDAGIGAPYVPLGERNAGRVFVHRGARGGLAPAAAWVLAAPGDAGDAPGAAVAGAGDVDGDGYADVLLGAHGAANSAGAAYLFRGSRAGPAGAPVALVAPRRTEGGRFGFAVSGAGDLNGDGFADVLVGEPGAPTPDFGEGRVHVYHGGAGGPATAPDATLRVTDAPLARFGRAALGVGDVDGDGYGDLAVGAPHAGARQGQVWVHRGGPAGVARAPALTLAGPDGAEGEFGLSLAGAR